jgi:hypothetical protein
MLENEKLRRADIFAGIVISLFGLWVISQAMQMPMKDSWGGVQNVWFVSPALFPLFVGGVIVLLGIGLSLTALKAVGLAGVTAVLNGLKGRELFRFLKSEPMMRFHAVVALLFSFVFLYIPRVDFFLGSVLFLAAFISMFYLDDALLLVRMLRVYLGGAVVTLCWFLLRLPGFVEAGLPYPSDWLTLAFILVYSLYVRHLTRGRPVLRRKLRTGLLLAVTAPFTIGAIFKYFLLVPMPTEGLIVAVMDAVRYWDF